MTAHAPALDLLDAAAVEALPDLQWLVAGVLPAPAFAVLYGEPGCGKTFTALSMALAIASGSLWLGRETRRAPVLYIAAEGVLGLKLRLRAHRAKHGVPPPNDAEMRFIASAIEIMKPDQVAALLAAMETRAFRPGLIVIDTLARVALGADENSASDMGRVVEGFDMLKRETGATVLAIHHSRKDGGAERGSSALRGAADVMIRCESVVGVTCGGVTLECAKMKDGEAFGTVLATLESVTLDGGGTSLVLGPGENIGAALRGIAGKQIVELLRTQFAETGATHAELKAAFVTAEFGSASSFDRAWRDLKGEERILVSELNKRKVFSLK